jgi:hypothetical protein
MFRLKNSCVGTLQELMQMDAQPASSKYRHLQYMPCSDSDRPWWDCDGLCLQELLRLSTASAGEVPEKLLQDAVKRVLLHSRKAFTTLEIVRNECWVHASSVLLYLCADKAYLETQGS